MMSVYLFLINYMSVLNVSYSFDNIHNDVIIDNICSYIDIKTVFTFASVSKNYNSILKNMLSTVITHDDFLINYCSKRKYNLLKVIENSSFEFYSFFQFYHNINQDPQPLFEMCFEFSENVSYHIQANTINNTFEIFKILMNLTMSKLKFQFRNCITKKLIEYFSVIYKLKFPTKKDISFDTFSLLISHRDDIIWYSSNINPYVLYENMNLFQIAPRSFDLRQNLENPTYNIELISLTHDKSIEFIMAFYNHIEDCNLQIYFLHTILEYLYFVFTKKELGNPYFQLLHKKNLFKQVIIQKTIYLQEIILDYNISRHIRKTISNTAKKLNEVL